VPRNLEFKAKARDLAALRQVFAKDGAVFVEDLLQVDTYYRVSNGRLKLRETVGHQAELIFYNREEGSASRMQSNYEVLRLADASVKGFLAQAIGVKVVVEKQRRLMKLGNARIHLDQVKDLGEFIEFEVVSESDDKRDAELLEKLKKLSEFSVLEEVNCSYSDLLLSGSSARPA
jgi:predicted adenylyl cyclase CyaB